MEFNGRNPLSFIGRVKRLNFALTQIVSGFSIEFIVLLEKKATISSLFAGICCLVLFYIGICSAIKRNRDLGLSPKYCLLVLIPFANLIYTFVLLFYKSDSFRKNNSEKAIPEISHRPNDSLTIEISKIEPDQKSSNATAAIAASPAIETIEESSQRIITEEKTSTNEKKFDQKNVNKKLPTPVIIGTLFLLVGAIVGVNIFKAGKPQISDVVVGVTSTQTLETLLQKNNCKWQYKKNNDRKSPFSGNYDVDPGCFKDMPAKAISFNTFPPQVIAQTSYNITSKVEADEKIKELTSKWGKPSETSGGERFKFVVWQRPTGDYYTVFMVDYDNGLFLHRSNALAIWGKQRDASQRKK